MGYDLTEDRIKSFRKYAASFASRYYRRFSLNTTMSFEDLIQEGMIGLLDAMSRYDPERDDTFPAYARMRISGQIIAFIRKEFPHLVLTHPIADDNGEWEYKVEEPYEHSRDLLDLERKEAVDALTKELQDHEKLILYLIYYENYTIREIASIVDKSSGSIHNMKWDILAKVRKVAGKLPCLSQAVLDTASACSCREEEM
jgi:RNA polymerase sigma factor (sigma-70 family)